MPRNLRNIFHRMAMTERQDVRTLWGVVVRLVEGAAARAIFGAPQARARGAEAGGSGEDGSQKGARGRAAAGKRAPE